MNRSPARLSFLRARMRNPLPLLLLALLLLSACVAPVYDQDGALVPVAPTAAVATATVPPLPVATAAPVDPALISSIGINPSLLSLNTQGLPFTWRANVVGATPVTTDAAGVTTGLPNHIQINFGNLEPSLRQPSDPVMYIIPVAEYLALWSVAGNDAVNLRVAEIFQRSIALPNPPPLRNLPALPFEETAGRQDFATQVGAPVDNPFSSSKNGFRFVGRFVDEATPVTNEQMQYVYQGFSNDGNFLVAFFFPAITNPALPAAVGMVSEAQMAEFNAGQDAALASTALTLYNDETSAWTPDVATLDAIVASLSIPGMPENALVGNVWVMTEIRQGDIVQTYNGGDLQVTFNAGGGFTFVADCNVGAGQYVISGGMAGSIAVQPGPMTMAACAEQSLSQGFVDGLNGAQEFRVWPLGDTLELIGAPNGVSMVLRNYGAPDLEVPTVEPPSIVFPTPEPQLPTGRVIADRGANIRSGPGTNFAIIGFAVNGTQILLAGRNSAGDWYAVNAVDLPGGVGWINAPLVASTNAADLPVIESPPTPVPPPTLVPSPTPIAPTPTPPPVVIVATPTPAAQINFTADRTRINQGECVTLSWNVQNVRAVWVYPLGANFRDFPVEGQGARQECPTATTTYEMRVELNEGLLELRQVTINVAAVNPLGNTNWLVSQVFGGPASVNEQSLTLTLLGDNTFNGFGGCNTVTGSYSVNGASISFSLNASTMMACDEAATAMQNAYQTALQSTSFYEWFGFQLLFRDFSGNETLRMLAN